jgi:KaiC/GvpD/RAD55 family RecA-like ATPase
LNPRVMRVTFSDTKDCRQEVMSAVRDMRSQGIVKEFVRDKGYSFRVLDAQKYQAYIKNFLNETLHMLRFVPPSPTYTPPVHCGWDSVGLLDEYPVPEGTPMNILLFGDPGPLKQLWSQHYMYGELLGGASGIYLSITSPPEDIRKNFQRFNKDLTQFEEKNTFLFIDCYPRRQKVEKGYCTPIDTSSLTDFGMVLSDAFHDLGSERGVVVFDSLSTLMLYFDPEQVIKFAVNQASRLKEWGWTGIFIVEEGVNDEKIENSLKFLLDGVFEIRDGEFRILWIRGMVDKPVRYALDISKRGLILLPNR